MRNPVGNSLAVSAYRLIPNSTDVSTFLEDRDWLTLNFAPIGNETRYHSPGDDLAAMDPATLQHMGDQLLQTVAAVAGQDSVDLRKRDGERLFMNIGTRWLISFPPSVAAGSRHLPAGRQQACHARGAAAAE